MLRGRFDGRAVGYALVAGLLSSVVPYAADLMALRWVQQHLFGVFMSLQPVLAALAGLTLLQQQLDLHEWVGLAIVALTNTVAVAAIRRRRHVLRG